MRRNLLLCLMFISLSFNAMAKDEIDFSMWPESLQKGLKKREEEKRKEAIEAPLRYERFFKHTQWITHEDPNTKPERHPRSQQVILTTPIILEGQRYIRDDVIKNAIDTALSDSIWLSNSFFQDRYKYKPIDGLIDKILPSNHVINKWGHSSKIKVTFKTLENNNQVDFEKYGYLISHLKELIKIYSEASNLDISYVEEVFPKRSDANVFIILNAKSSIQNAFKNDEHGSLPDENQHESNYVSAVRFTPKLWSQVEGFFIPNLENEIKKATCYLKPALISENLTKALLAECMARILGIPTKSRYVGILSNWNISFNELMIRGLRAGEFYRERRYSYAQWKELVKKQIESQDAYPIFPNEFDLKVISLLYCPFILSGMDKHEALLTLLDNEICIRQPEIEED